MNRSQDSAASLIRSPSDVSTSSSLLRRNSQEPLNPGLAGHSSHQLQGQSPKPRITRKLSRQVSATTTVNPAVVSCIQPRLEMSKLQGLSYRCTFEAVSEPHLQRDHVSRQFHLQNVVCQVCQLKPCCKSTSCHCNCSPHPCTKLEGNRLAQEKASSCSSIVVIFMRLRR